MKTDMVHCGVRKLKEEASCYLSNCFDGKTDPLEAFCGEHVLAIWEMRGAVWYTGQRVLSLVAVGVKLFPFNGTEFGRVLYRLLTLLGHHDASQVTLKSFRAGRATSPCS